jgi:LCP family protein required for cell wall assembly
VKIITKLSNPLKIVIVVLSSILLIAIGIYIYIHSLLSNIKQTNIQPQIPSNPQVIQDTTFKVKDPIPQTEKAEDKGVTNIALFGLDRRETTICRSDTIIIATIDMDNRKIKLASLMRDTYVEIPGKWKDRINAAYAYGGPALAIETINKNFDMDIKYYISVDFKGIRSIIDELGGTEINVKEGEIPHINSGSDSEIKSAGLQHLDGQQTLSYMRIRYFGNGDYERTERQRVVLSQLYDKVKSSGIPRLTNLLPSILSYVETNIEKIDIINLTTACLRFSDNVEQYRIPADGTFSEKIIQHKSVIVPDLKENIALLHKFIYHDNEKTSGPIDD